MLPPAPLHVVLRGQTPLDQVLGPKYVGHKRLAAQPRGPCFWVDLCPGGVYMSERGRGGGTGGPQARGHSLCTLALAVSRASSTAPASQGGFTGVAEAEDTGRGRLETMSSASGAKVPVWPPPRRRREGGRSGAQRLSQDGRGLCPPRVGRCPLLPRAGRPGPEQSLSETRSREKQGHPAPPSTAHLTAQELLSLQPRGKGPFSPSPCSAVSSSRRDLHSARRTVVGVHLLSC